MVSAEYTLVELADAAGMSARNVRSYRQRGLLAAPRLRGRKGYFGPEHLSQLRTVQALLARGLSLQEIASALHDREGQAALELLLVEPPDGTEGESVGQLMQSTVETLALQRPGATERIVDLGIMTRSDSGQLLVDAGLLARANELLAGGTRLRVLTDIIEAAGRGAQRVGADLQEIATDPTSGTQGDVVAYVDLATWSFRAALRHALASGASRPSSRPAP